ncbi:EF-hand domain-containing family member B [Hippoglossus stenolepis]|uniref:EF-hand domain-containing family member B n=1 Tax=Hippoglossus stenolepis TaxID=195615 RepID=UPI001FAF0FAF|nr:EF-hand domain-containing family member B [Hippoglossus stenolepis]
MSDPEEHVETRTPTAGKLTPGGDTAEMCLQEVTRPSTPPEVRKFRMPPEPGAVRVHPGKADDPDVASTLVHGMRNIPCPTVRSLINPPPKTVFQNKLQELSEADTLGSGDQQIGLPTVCNDKTPFGDKTVWDHDMWDIINPKKTAEQLKKDAQAGHENYVRTHNAYFPGEQIDRKYDWTQDGKDSRFGKATPHFNDGRTTGKTLCWFGESRKFYNPKTVWTRSGDKDRMQQKSDNANKMRRNPLNFSPDHIFGLPKPLDEFGAGEVIHSAEPGQYVRVPDQQHSLVSAVRIHLKRVNFQNFPSLLQAFRHYDKNGKGMINRDDLLAVCRQFHLDVGESVVDDLIDYCDTDKERHINFLEFANFLNWKDRMPINARDRYIMTNAPETSTAPADIDKMSLSQPEQLPAAQALIDPEDMEPVAPGSSKTTVRTLRRLREAPDHFLTSASFIGADRDRPLTSNSRTYGIPSVRADLPAPRVTRVTDTINYGDKPSVADLLNPSVPALQGVYKEHFFCPRTKEEIAEIFRNVGVEISEETFEEAWTLASMRQPDGEVCVQVFSNVLKEIQAM